MLIREGKNYADQISGRQVHTLGFAARFAVVIQAGCVPKRLVDGAAGQSDTLKSRQ